MSGERYARQMLIERWDQKRLREARILVAGAGALGNETLKNLALLGIGELIVVDFDLVELSNLSRTVLFTEEEIGRPKAEAAARSLRRLNPEVEVMAIYGDLFSDVGLGLYRHSDLVIGCLDNLAARAQVGRSACLAGIPYLDGGMWAFGGEARWLMGKDGPCFDCTLTESDRARADQRRSCSGFQEKEDPDYRPTVATTAAIIGGLLAQEAVRWLHGYPVQEGKALVYNGQALSFHRAELARNPRCPSSHFPYENVVELTLDGTTGTARHLFRWVRENFKDPHDLFLNLGRDFLLRLTCPNCGKVEEIFKAWAKVPAAVQACPVCAAQRRPEVLVTLSEADTPYSDWPLARLGVPAGEVVAVHSAQSLYLFELAVDFKFFSAKEK